MSEMPRKTVVFHVRRKKLFEVSVLVAGNVLWPSPPCSAQPPRKKKWKTIAWYSSGRSWGSGACKVAGCLGKVDVCKVCRQAAQRQIGPTQATRHHSSSWSRFYNQVSGIVDVRVSPTLRVRPLTARKPPGIPRSSDARLPAHAFQPPTTVSTRHSMTTSGTF